jgi:DNA-directed RNA polymerase subunit RPC12/RpoP
MERKFRFLCANCGAEVPSEDDRCPLCGHRFGGVQCTHCGATGPQSAFLTGCPSCGYGVAAAASPPGKPRLRAASPRFGPWALYLAVILAVALVGLLLVVL